MSVKWSMKQADTESPTNSQRNTYRLIWRWHFYAGIFCLPFIIWLSLTGMVYLFKPQIEPLLERRLDSQVSGHLPAHVPSAIVTAALKAVPGTVLNAYELPLTAGSAVRVLVGRGPDLYRVFVNPENLDVLAVNNEKSRLMRVIFYLHGELLLGQAGSMLVELVAGWTILMLLSGLYLWWPRERGLAGVLYPRRGRQGRPFWRDLHAVTGFWISLFALFLLVSGLPWTKSWGGMFKSVREWHAGVPLVLDWTTGSASERAQIAAANTPAPDGHAGHAASEGGGDTVSYIVLDRMVPRVRALALPAPVLIAPPSLNTPRWTARSDTQNRPQRVSLTLDQRSAEIIARQDFTQKPLLDRVIAYGIAIHEGQLFPPYNQILNVFTALGMLTLAVSSVLMWWRRRPPGLLGAPPPLAHMRYPGLFVGGLVGLGILLPLLGASMLLVWMTERVLLRSSRQASRFLGI
ncbi:MAG: PepSY domain-containing protein [Pseudomonadales bacterium]|nr:PepSY domain-containing protein [Pseudomonadales bacterium]